MAMTDPRKPIVTADGLFKRAAKQIASRQTGKPMSWKATKKWLKKANRTNSTTTQAA